MLRRAFEFAKTVYFNFNNHNGFLLAAGIAFFIFFALFPLLLSVGIILGYVLESAELRRQVLEYVFQSVPGLADVVRDQIEKLIRARSSAGIIAFLGLLWSGTGLFGGLALGLNAVYEVKETRNIVTQRLLAIAVLIIVIVLFLVSSGATSIAAVFRDEVLSSLFPGQVVTYTWRFLSYAIGLVSTLLLFLVVYRLVPNVKRPLKSIWPGTLAAGTLWEIGKYGFAFYLENFATRGYGAVYGSLATIVLVLFWLNISSMLLLLGAEINVVYHHREKGGVKIFGPKAASQPFGGKNI